MKILAITGSRADAAAIHAVVDALLCAKHGVSILNLASEVGTDDHRWSIAHDTALVIRKVSDKVFNHPPDLVLLHGDRSEILGAAIAAFLMGLPIAHIGGGDITEGSQDDSMRHAVSKLSHLHFVSHKEAAQRLIQLGEDPARVFNTGDPGIDALKDMLLPNKHEVLHAVGLDGYNKFFLVGLHPNTLGDSLTELHAVVGAIRACKDESVGFVLLDPNRDAGYSLIEDAFLRLADDRRIVYCQNLERLTYLSLLKHCVALIGNSSAGFYEAPSFGTLVINVGNRQQGRIPSKNIVFAKDVGELQRFMTSFLVVKNINWKPDENPYGDGRACERIVDILGKIDLPALLHKKFCEPDTVVVTSTLAIGNCYLYKPCPTQFGSRYTPAEPGAATPTSSSSDGRAVTTAAWPRALLGRLI